MRKILTNGLVLVVTVLFCLVAAEGATRLVDGLPLTSVALPASNGGGIGLDTSAEHLDEIPRAAGVAREWFFEEPPPLPNRHAEPEEWKRAAQQSRESDTVPDGRFKSWDLYKAWNAARVGDPCANEFFAGIRGRIYVFDPPDGSGLPPFRYLPNATTPMGLVTNEFGWRGAPVTFPRTAGTVRIVFVGASTTAGPHAAPFSYPELVGHWLNMWAAAHRPDIRFEVLNAAREGLNSTSIAAVVREEVAPTNPDLVVYYEGGNQFKLTGLAKGVVPTAARPQPKAPEGIAAWLNRASQYSALARRLQALTGFKGISEGGHELPKPDYALDWPPGLDESDPDLGHPDLPVNLGTILHDLDAIRDSLGTVGSEFALSSFRWLVKDGMVVHPVRNRLLWDYLNVHNYPFRYRDIARLAAFQNRVLAKYASAHGLPFIDVDGVMPFDADLYADAVHETYPGMRLKAWVFVQQLIPVIEQRLASGAWPRAVPAMADTHPAFAAKPREMDVDCKLPPKAASAGVSP
ncbi:MAG: SGNH/GDSL hydrolase family protein [Pseudomonadota bacterium]